MDMVGERLREARQAQRLSLCQVAEKAEISAATLSRIETNKQSVDIALFLTIVRILKVAPHEMLGDDGKSRHESNPLALRIVSLGTSQRAKLWRDLAGGRRADRNSHRDTIRSLGQQVEELLAQVDFLRQELESLRLRVKKRK